MDPNIVQLVEDEPFDLKMFMQKYDGITPTQFIDYKGYCGDTSDNIPGVTGIGPKGAIELLKTYGSMEAAVSEINRKKDDPKLKGVEKKLLMGSESGLLSRELATILLDVPEMKAVAWEDLAIKINRSGYLEMMAELEIEVKSNAA
ncbi:5'-3' exonuclease H3TH domain-containing protein [Paenibacillus glucanolyticus]|uniref:5'-3' exonuclease H3TH domain-containing protein n=1 Tax=Paenibacillus glucanolyticus TaxID=59843 RepID=UPI0013E38410|nr:5'-3' exonuclease H3TH domain-containing protein [Paenibacillus glucanolyticus]